MADDAELADLVREHLGNEPRLSERKMFGGLAFLISGHMGVVVSGEGGLMIRSAPDRAASLVAETPARFAEMRGTTMKGWVRIAGEHLHDASDVAEWADRGIEFAASLPPKR